MCRIFLIYACEVFGETPSRLQVLMPCPNNCESSSPLASAVLQFVE
jgi:hypothetical protein